MRRLRQLCQTANQVLPSLQLSLASQTAGQLSSQINLALRCTDKCLLMQRTLLAQGHLQRKPSRMSVSSCSRPFRPGHRHLQWQDTSWPHIKRLAGLRPWLSSRPRLSNNCWDASAGPMLSWSAAACRACMASTLAPASAPYHLWAPLPSCTYLQCWTLPGPHASCPGLSLAAHSSDTS